MATGNVTSTMKGIGPDVREESELMLPVAGPGGREEAPAPEAVAGEATEGEEPEESDDEERVGFAAWPVWAKFALWLSGSSALGYAVSALVHSAVMVALSIVVVHGAGGIGGPNTLLGFNAGVGNDLGGGGTEDGLDTRLDLDGGESSPLAIETQAIQTLTPQALATNTIPALNSIPQLGAMSVPNDGGTGTGAKGGAKGKGGGMGAGLPSGIQGFGMPGGGKAVVKGNFTAWTVPEDPKPYESYLIVVQVNLPRRFTTLPEGDVTGWVTGTDNYHLNINDYTSTYFPKSKQVVVRIPGAERRVRDTIHVQSKILSEKQDLKIEF